MIWVVNKAEMLFGLKIQIFVMLTVTAQRKSILCNYILPDVFLSSDLFKFIYPAC